MNETQSILRSAMWINIHSLTSPDCYPTFDYCNLPPPLKHMRLTTTSDPACIPSCNAVSLVEEPESQ